ncbi:enoyl-CoA hydratase/isomerase family protein [Micromonospora sp. NPDC050417]|uniref:enoyl-CoA hydratase/isomerase family protein n=1 Tax=Micromonospora sp. NPDC050417 TaxID=3364280 RepID=UPI00378B6756
MTKRQFTTTEIDSSYWRITFSNGDINLMDADTLEQLAELVAAIEQAPDLKVVVFDSANPDYFIAHWDVFADTDRVGAMAPGPTGLHPYIDNFVRLSRVPAVTISAIRGRARGAGSEFALATDIRFAGHKAILGQFEVGVGAVPGGGAMTRLARLVGRARAMEIVLGSEDVPAEVAERIGYVNRTVPDAELDAHVDAFARRIAGFEKHAVAGAKKFIDEATLPDDNSVFAAGLNAFFQSAGRSESVARIAALLERGFQQPDGVERDLGRHVAEYRADATVTEKN